MSSQRGSAIITVMLMIAILALAGAALLLQSRMDTRMTRSQLSYDRTLSLGDGASKVSYAVLSIATTDSYTYNGHQTRKFVAEAGGQSTATSEAGTGTILTRGQDSSNVGYWDSYMTLAGYRIEAQPGYEINQYLPAVPGWRKAQGLRPVRGKRTRLLLTCKVPLWPTTGRRTFSRLPAAPTGNPGWQPIG